MSESECPRLTFIGVPNGELGVTDDRRYVKDQSVVNMCTDWCQHEKCWLDCTKEEELWEEWDVYFNEEEKAKRVTKRAKATRKNRRV